MKANSFTFNKRTKGSRLVWSIAAAMSLGAGMSNVAFAQNLEDEMLDLEEITVTGSRIRRDDFSNPQPTTVLDSDFLQNIGIVNIGDAMSQLPSNVGNNTPTANAGGNFFNGSNIANLRGLNPFFGSRTLTLVDSRRHVPTNQGDGVDLNFVPSILIDRMEVVTGGASASYGSGAIGGVTNILMDRDLEGGKVQIDFGTTAESDGDDTHYGLAWGSKVGENGHFVIAVEGQDMDSITNCATARDWCAKGAGIEENLGYATNGEPRYFHAEDRRSSYRTSNGVVVSTAGPFEAFFFPRNPATAMVSNAEGTALSPFNPGTFGDDGLAGLATGIGGDGDHVNKYSLVRSNVDRQTAYISYTHEVSDDLNFFVETSFGSVKTKTPQGSFILPLDVLAADNAYLLQIDTAGSFPLGGQYSKEWAGIDGIDVHNDTETDMLRVAFGFDGRFGDSSWTWDAYYQYGKSERVQSVNDNRHLTRHRFATDAVFAVDGDQSSEIVCRVTRDGLAAGETADPRLADGCVPISIFGVSASAAAIDYSFGYLEENTDVEQSILEGIASGEIYEGFGAGPVLAAVGLSWRDESIENIAADIPAYERTDFVIQYGESFSGEVEVLEYFAEIDVPLTDSFNVQGAIRNSSYTNTAGEGTLTPGTEYDYDITTWKVNANWTATDWLTLRASKSLDIRAPNFRELYYGQLLQPGGFGSCNNEWSGNTQDPCVIHLLGGLSLKPEEADTITAGFVISLDDYGVRFAADYYEIEISDAITPASSGLVLDECFENQNPAFCSQIQGTLIDPNNPLGGFSDITDVFPEARNFRAYKVRGVDFSADWSGDYDFGSLSLRLLASRNLEQTIQPSATDNTLTRNIAGVTGGSDGFLADWAASPDLTGQLIGTYMKGPYTVTLQGRFVADGLIYADRYDSSQTGYYAADGVTPSNDSIDNNQVPSYAVWALNASYDFNVGNSKMSVFTSINNLFDKQPPLVGTGQGTNATFFDTIGRNYRIGIRANF